MKNLILPIVAVLAILGLLVFLSTSSKKQPSQEISPYDENAKVMYFYSEQCSWCQKQKTVLEELAKDGYQIKPMDVGAQPDYWTEYEIKGTPTFIAPDGERLVGYTEKEKLKDFLDKHK